jgi:hypothetical protein
VAVLRLHVLAHNGLAAVAKRVHRATLWQPRR